MSEYSEHFLIRGKDVSQHAADYLSGLLGTYRRKNLECIHGDIPESNYQAMQQFVSDSPWSQDKLMAMRKPSDGTSPTCCKSGLPSAHGRS